MKLNYAVKTDIGKVRDHNEDFYGICLEKNLFFVCDGMGGHVAGDYASKTVAGTIIELVRKDHGQDINRIIAENPADIPLSARCLASFIMLANRKLFKLALMYPRLRGMGTTIAAVMFENGIVNVVNVGDSRVYRFRGSELTQLSVDHSWIEEMLQDGEIEESEASTFAQKNVITRALGTNQEVQVDWKGGDVKYGDIYLVCSDGLCSEVDDQKIAVILKENRKNLNEAASRLIEAANNSGGSDNITVVLVGAEEDLQTPLASLYETKTISSSKNAIAAMDSYIARHCPSSRTKVPEGVRRERKKVHKNLVFIILAVGLMLTGVLAILKPFRKPAAPAANSPANGNILIKTDPAQAMVSLYSNGELIDKKVSPADFSSLNEGEYVLEIKKQGYKKERIKVDIKKDTQKVETVSLDALVKMVLSLSMKPGFDPNLKIYLDGRPIEYYGTPLTVNRIGLVGKTINISAHKKHTLKIGNEKIELSPSPGTKKEIRIKLDLGKIVMEN